MHRCSDEILRRVARLDIIDDERTQRYISGIDAHTARLLGEEGDFARRLLEGDIRDVTAGAGLLAFAYAFPRSRFHGDARLLDGFRTILARLLEGQHDTGELALGDAPFPPHPHASHGQAWFLEPLLLGMTWLADAFAPEEKARIDRAFYRVADFLAARPIPEMNNRGVIVCAILALCGRYFRDNRFLSEAVQRFHREPAKVFDDRSGQIFEGSGPDGNYSGTTFEYLYIYRLFSDDDAIDRAMIAALKWYARAMDPNGRQMFAGAATRQPVGHSASKVHDILPGLERYSSREPFFQRMIEQYLPLVEEANGLGAFGHSVSPTVWALLEHPAVAAPAEPPAWYADMRSWYWEDPQLGPQHFGYNEGYESLYFPIRTGRVSTCIAMRGRAPHKDMQAWTYGVERPVIYAAKQRASRTRAWGIDTAVQGVSHVKLPNFCWVLGDVDGLIGQWETVWRYYVFTPRTTFTFTDGECGRLEIDWIVDQEQCGTPEVGEGVLRYAERAGRLHFGCGAPQCAADGDVLTCRWQVPVPPVWFAFSDDSFALDEASPGTMRFRDASGAYAIDYSFVPGPPDLTERIPCFAWTEQKRLQIRRV